MTSTSVLGRELYRGHIHLIYNLSLGEIPRRQQWKVLGAKALKSLHMTYSKDMSWLCLRDIFSQQSDADHNSMRITPSKYILYENMMLLKRELSLILKKGFSLTVTLTVIFVDQELLCDITK